MPFDMRVAMVARIARGFDQLVDDGARRGAVGIAHAEVDHILLRCPCLCLHLIDDGEHVGRQLLDAVKLVGRSGHEDYFTGFGGSCARPYGVGRNSLDDSRLAIRAACTT